MPNIEVLSADSVRHLLRDEPKLQAEPLPPEVVWASPLDVCFSQNVIYPKFSDGKSIDDAVRSIEALEPGSGTSAAEGAEGVAGAEDIVDLILEPPFPTIEAVRWSPKLRDGEGRPIEDAEGAHRRASEALFTVDNRRLYALQRAAVAQWPRRCATRVLVIVDRGEVLKHLKKFRTRSNGLSINVSEWHGVGRDNARDFTTMRIWDWRSAVARADDAAAGGGAAAALGAVGGQGGQGGGLGGGDEAAAPGASSAAESGSCGCWEYLDNQGVRRGPFSHWQMRQWWEMEMLPRDLRIRAYDAAATASEKDDLDLADSVERQFRLVDEVFAEAPIAFAPGWSPRVTDREGEWKKCGQCNRKRWEGYSANGVWFCSACWRRFHRQAGSSFANDREPGRAEEGRGDEVKKEQAEGRSCGQAEEDWKSTSDWQTSGWHQEEGWQQQDGWRQQGNWWQQDSWQPHQWQQQGEEDSWNQGGSRQDRTDGWQQQGSWNCWSWNADGG